MTLIAETPRLRLRTWAAGDADAFEAACNTPAVMRHLGGPQARAEIEAGVSRMMQCQADHGYCFWVVERVADAAFLGFCGLKRLDAEGAPESIRDRPEIGWRLREDVWGQGYAREAAAAALGVGFARPDIDAIYAITVAANMSSWGLMRRLGMTALPALDFDMPVYGPHIVYGLERSRWRA